MKYQASVLRLHASNTSETSEFQHTNDLISRGTKDYVSFCFNGGQVTYLFSLSCSLRVAWQELDPFFSHRFHSTTRITHKSPEQRMNTFQTVALFLLPLLATILGKHKS